MSRIVTVASALALACAISAPAAAANITFNFGGASQTFATGAPYEVTAGGATASALGYSFNTTPAAFQTLADGASAATVLSQMTLKSVRREGPGIGVCWTGESGSECNQVDANGTNEMLRVELSKNFRLVSAEFDRVDNNDTLKLFGVSSDGVVDHLGYGGIFDGPGTTMGINDVSGAWVSGTGDNQVYSVTFETGAFKEFWFGNNNDTADGYRLRSITVAAVPEPATWALMIGGFGLAGATLRRRNAATSTATA
ncbi:MAG: PEPxxWA-CTERM sorting domain-containing protein [Phenylobacterium sp.]|nr:PEPxxWA-CTERM sorting domain-containing protein [Phenylobacterium sp.]